MKLNRFKHIFYLPWMLIIELRISIREIAKICTLKYELVRGEKYNCNVNE